MVHITMIIFDHRSIEIRFRVAAGQSVRKEGNFCKLISFKRCPAPTIWSINTIVVPKVVD